MPSHGSYRASDEAMKVLVWLADLEDSPRRLHLSNGALLAAAAVEDGIVQDAGELGVRLGELVAAGHVAADRRDS